MKPRYLVVFIKELRETLRDRRALGLLILMVVMYPLILAAILQKQIDSATETEREGIELAVIGAAQAPNLMSALKQRNVIVHTHPDMDEAAITALLADKKLAAVLRLPEKFGSAYAAMRPAPLELWFDSSSGDNRGKRREVEDMLRDYSADIAGARLLAHGVSPAVLAPIRLERFDTGSSAARSAAALGAMLGAFFIPAFIFCLSTVVDSTAGERERRSLEVLMAQPVHARDLIAGKWLAAASLSVVGITLELLLAHFVLKWLPLEEIGMSWRMGVGQLLAVCLTAIPLCLFAAALELALAMNAKSFKEAQTTVTFAILLPIAPMVVIPMLNLPMGDWMYLVPVVANQTLLSELSKGQELGLLPYVLTALSSLLIALALAAFATWRMKSEKYVLSV